VFLQTRDTPLCHVIRISYVFDPSNTTSDYGLYLGALVICPVSSHRRSFRGNMHNRKYMNDKISSHIVSKSQYHYKDVSRFKPGKTLVGPCC
jgi:hypothetical protein